MEHIQVAVLGATGYTGAELIRLIEAHPVFEIGHLGAHSHAGRKVAEVLPGLGGKTAELYLSPADADLDDAIELVFTALPHGAAAECVGKALAQGKKVVDLSADFRHQDPETYRAAYGVEHPYPHLLRQAVFGLTEWVRDELANASLVANPGCYPTSTLLALIPLLRHGVLDDGPVIVDAKSGASGAGRGAKTELLYCEVNESIKAYGLPRHRHTWEMEEWALALGGSKKRIRFVPHLVPMNRGMLTTLHLSGRQADDWHSILQETYANEPFVRVLPPENLPCTGGVRGSNRCDIGVSVLSGREAVVVSCIDNLLKGASGQAVQNANVLFGLNEQTGLSPHALWP